MQTVHFKQLSYFTGKLFTDILGAFILLLGPNEVQTCCFFTTCLDCLALTAGVPDTVVAMLPCS